MQPILISRSALDQMLAESQACATETGGVLIGTIGIPIVLATGTPGPKAQKFLASFSTDPEHDRLELLHARRKFGRMLHLLGYWHKHPPGMSHPSGDDLLQARHLLSDLRDLGEKDPELFVIILQPNEQYFAYRLSSRKHEFEPLATEVIADHSTQITQVLDAEKRFVISDLRGDPWSEENFHFHMTPIGRIRLEREQQLLQERGYRIQVLQRKDNQRVSFHIEKNSVKYLCVFPREYPLNMPRIFRLPAMDEIYPFSRHMAWNSDIYVVDWLEALHRSEQISQPIIPAQSSAQKQIPPAHVFIQARNIVNNAVAFTLLATGCLVGLILGYRRARKKNPSK